LFSLGSPPMAACSSGLLSSVCLSPASIQAPSMQGSSTLRWGKCIYMCAEFRISYVALVDRQPGTLWSSHLHVIDGFMSMMLCPCRALGFEMTPEVCTSSLNSVLRSSEIRTGSSS
jgi:hypothetical protein